jgi:hypothetical protein
MLRPLAIEVDVEAEETVAGAIDDTIMSRALAEAAVAR